MSDTGYTLPFFLQTYHYPDGLPLSGGKLYFFVAGSTNIAKNVYADREKTIPLTQPIVLDAGGTAQQYYAEDGLYKIVLTTSTGTLVATRDYVDGAGGSGTGGDAYTVKANPTDTAPATLIEKVQNTASVTWSTGSVSGVQKVWADVDPSAVLDYKVKADPSDPSPDFLDAKVEDGYYVEMWVNPTTHKIQSNFTGPAYVPVTGGVYTGPVTIPTLTSTTINTGALNVTNNAIIGGTTTTGAINAGSGSITNLISGNMVVSGLSGSNNNVVMVNSSGQLYKEIDPLYKVKVSATDTLGQYLGLKILPGTGIQFTTVVDGTGEHIAISTQTPPRLDMYKVSNGYRSTATYNTTPKDFWTQVGIQTYGSLLIPGGTIKPGMRLRMVHKILNATAAFTMVISQTGTGTGSSMTIAVPAGTSHVEIDYQYNPTFGDVYQNRVAFYQIINTTNPNTGVVPNDGQGLDITANMAFTITCQTATGSTTVGLHDVTLWVIP